METNDKQNTSVGGSDAPTCSPSPEFCPFCNGWGIEPSDEFSPCRAGCNEDPELEQIKAIIKDITDDLFSSENQP
jgi:hypothetical protein